MSIHQVFKDTVKKLKGLFPKNTDTELYIPQRVLDPKVEKEDGPGSDQYFSSECAYVNQSDTSRLDK